MLEVLLDETKDQAQILPIFSYGVLGIGFILIETYLPSTAALFNVLLGDLLLVTKNDLLSLSAMVVLVWFLWLRYQKEVLLSILIPDLAILRKIQIRKMNLIKNIITGLAISFVIQAAGMLLSMALLTIPPLTAKMACKSPQQMVITTCAISFISMSLGFYFGLRFDVSLGATMSCCCLLVFVTVKVALLLQQKIRLKSSA